MLAPTARVFGRVALGLALVAGAIFVPSARADASTRTDAMEVRVLQLINQGRGGVGKGAEVMHAGLRAKARLHSAYQSSIRGLTHSGLSDRISGASPDPIEANGAPTTASAASAKTSPTTTPAAPVPPTSRSPRGSTAFGTAHPATATACLTPW